MSDTATQRRHRGPSTVDLDHLDLDRLDPQDMLGTVESSPGQWRSALRAARAAPAPPEFDDLRAVIVAGMGGSGIAADIAATAATIAGRVPVVPAKGYDVGGLAGPDTLVILVSHSGNTEETLACYRSAGKAKAKRYAVTAGGHLAEFAEADGVPIAHVVQGGQPRAALPSLVTPVLVALERAGVISDVIDELEAVADHLDAVIASWNHEVPTADNLVKQVAMALDGRVPLFVGGRGWQAVAALRGKCQVNENAQRPAFAAELPELDHNEIVGWRALPEVGERFGIVELRSPEDEHPQTARRFAITADVIGDGVGTIQTFETSGPSPIARFATSVLFVDLLSVHLAFLEEQDPTPVEAIDTLKRRLAEDP